MLQPFQGARYLRPIGDPNATRVYPDSSQIEYTGSVDDILNPIQGEFHSPDSLQGGSDERDIEDDPFRESEDEPDPQKFYYEDISVCSSLTSSEASLEKKAGL